MNDLISRQAAIQALYCDAWLTPETRAELVEALERLPSIRAEKEIEAFIEWLLEEIWDDDLWELNCYSFPEALCRKLVKLGYLKKGDGTYERLN